MVGGDAGRTFAATEATLPDDVSETWFDDELATPVVDDGVLVHAGEKWVEAVSPDGGVLWDCRGLHSVSRPLVLDDLVVVGTWGPKLVGIERGSGEKRWSVSLSNISPERHKWAGTTGPPVATTDGVFSTALPGIWRATSNGAEQWGTSEALPLDADVRLRTAVGKRKAYLVATRRFDATNFPTDRFSARRSNVLAYDVESGDLAWQFGLSGRVPGFAVRDGAVHLLQTAYDSRNEGETISDVPVLSRYYRLDGESGTTASVVDLTAFGELHAMALADRPVVAGGKELTDRSRVFTVAGADSWVHETENRVGDLVATGAAVLYSMGDTVVCLDRSDGTVRWRHTVGKRAKLAAVVDGGVYVETEAGVHRLG